MALSTELISQFAKIVAPKETRPEFTTVTGRAKLYDGKIYVQIDGSDQLTPIASSTVGIKDNDWVTVQIKNHSATITGNATDPSAGTSYADDIKDKVEDVSDQISEFEIVIADKVDVDVVNAISGRIDNLVSENVTITGKLDAVEGTIDNLTAENATITGKLEAVEGDIDHLESSKAEISVLESKYATIENLEATNADIHDLEADYGSFKQLTTDNFTAVNGSITNLETNKLSVADAEIQYAKINFANINMAAVEELFAKSGIIEDLIVSEGHITGELVGVTIKGDLIEGNTIKADKLVVLGSDGLYYKLNVNAETIAAEQTEYNSLNGKVITANTITAEKINVDDLVAFNATIGGFKIGSSSIYSGVKASIDNVTPGIYMDDTGQLALGDTNNYLKYFKDTDGTWKLELSSAVIKMGGTSSTLDQVIDDLQQQIDESDSIEIGGRNLINHINITEDYNIDSAGELVANDGYLTTDYIPIDSSAEYCLTVYKAATDFTDDPSGVYVTVAVYDENKSFNARALYWDDLYLAWKNETIGPFTDSTKYARISFPEGLEGAIKFERGNKPTDWTPAPEDIQSGINNAQSSADSAQNAADESIERVSSAEITIDSINSTIESLVVGEDGQSLMTQTENGFRFDFSSFQEQIQNALDTAVSAENDYSQLSTDVDSIKNSVEYITELNSYITMGDEAGVPYIELGQIDGSFKVRITNTEMAFMQGTDRIAYITNKQLYIQSSVVTDEMKIGYPSGYIWKKRGNNHMGLRWVNS